MRLALRPAALLCLLLAAGPAGAAPDTCPDIPAEEAGLRRSMAKEWFARAEEAEAGADLQAAVKRYACSLKLAPHPSTAYNLGTAAEKAGDLSMAADAFRMYTNLAPDAPDRAAVDTRVARLEARIADLRSQLDGKATTGGDAAPPAVNVPPAGQPRDVVVQSVPPPAAHPGRVAGWVTVGLGVAAAGTGVAFNLMARDKMSSCYARWNMGDDTALDLCESAKTFAYGSYGLFGLAGALGITGVTLLLWRSGSGGSGGDTGATSLSLLPAPGGGGLLASGRF